MDSDDSAKDAKTVVLKSRRKSSKVVEEEDSPDEGKNVVASAPSASPKITGAIPYSINDGDALITFTDSESSEASPFPVRNRPRTQSFAVVESDSDASITSGRAARKKSQLQDKALPGPTPPESADTSKSKDADDQIPTPRKFRRLATLLKPLPSPSSQQQAREKSPTRRSSRIKQSQSSKQAYREEVVSLLSTDKSGRVKEEEEDKDEYDDDYADEYDLDPYGENWWYDDLMDPRDAEDLDGFVVSDREDPEAFEGTVFDCVCGTVDEAVPEFTGPKVRCTMIDCGDGVMRNALK
ncbi:hypothetical protein BC829DRAFT_264308 [Chytridium lagenaria]|nr:hypothetical protein BC829DRAFT_264308 [Chytridium lagenaria]